MTNEAACAAPVANADRSVLGSERASGSNLPQFTRSAAYGS